MLIFCRMFVPVFPDLLSHLVHGSVGRVFVSKAIHRADGSIVPDPRWSVCIGGAPEDTANSGTPVLSQQWQ